MEYLAGQTLGQFELRSLLGMGGMGAVYEAYQPSLQRLVAVKVLFPGQAQQLGNFEERFVREARMSAMLEHPHIVPVYDYGIEGGTSYVVMRLLGGRTLDERLQNCALTGSQLPLDEILKITHALASALAYAHQQGVIHRDIKPSNVMFDDHGTPLLVDFGLARLAEESSKLTVTGKMIGTPEYMAPEQWRNEPLTPAIDQYALALVVYEMLTGQRVFDADTHYQLMQKHTQETPRLTQHWPDNIPAATVPVLSRALRKYPNARYPKIQLFAEALTTAINGESEADEATDTASDSPPTQNRNKTLILIEEPGETRPRNQRGRWAFMAAAVITAIIVGGAILIPGLPGAVVAINDTPTLTGGANQITGTPAIAGSSGNSGLEDASPTSTPRPTDTALPTRNVTETPSQTHTALPTITPSQTDTPSPTNTATHTPSPTIPGSPTSTGTPTSTAASPLAIIAEVSCNQMDINDDGMINIYDLRTIAAVIGSTRGGENYRPDYDFDNNSVIDDFDLTRVTSQYDRRCT